MVNFNIASTGNEYFSSSDIKPIDGVELLSFDRGITHAQLQNGMKVAILPCGKGNTLMMRRICEGGSRLESAETAGAAHVLEHADFRNIDWLSYGAIDKNASTSKLFIEHQAYMLLDPAAQHVEKEMLFQRDTMMGNNIRTLPSEDIVHEVNNVKDEGLYNGQSGMAARNMIMKMEELLLPRVWTSGWVAPTIGIDRGQRISVSQASELVDLHHQLRGPSRTTLVLAGPIDTQMALQMASDVFSSVRDNRSELLPLPQTRTPTPQEVAVANVSTDAGTNGVCIGFLAPPFGRDMEVLSVMQHLVGMLAQQPGVKSQGLEDVSMYITPDKNASVVSFLCGVKQTGASEESLLRNAQHTLEQQIIAPLRSFNDDGIVRELLRQYRTMINEALVSDPQTVAALAIQGVMAADKPSLAWHVDTRFANREIDASRVRDVATRIFDPRYMGIVRNTRSSTGQTALAQSTRTREYTLSLIGQKFKMTPSILHQPFVMDTSHIGPDLARPLVRPIYIRPGEDAGINKVTIRMAGQDVGNIAYNTVSVLPLSKKKVTALFGDTSRYGGWAKATLVTAALNEIAKATNASACKFKIKGNQVTGTVESSAAQRTAVDFVQPLVTSVAMAAALSMKDMQGVRQLQQTLPKAALDGAVDSVRDNYKSLPYLVQAQTRSKVCTVTDPGYQPADFSKAVQQLYEHHESVLSLLALVHSAEPTLAGTNMTQPALARLATGLLRIAQSGAPARAVAQLIDPSEPQPADLKVVQVVQGIQTFPFMAAIPAQKPLARADRAAFILSNQVMVGGMGAVYTHDIRQNGVSYRPSGSVALSWQDNPVLTLNATFDTADLETGRMRTVEHLTKWSQGDTELFTDTRITQAKNAVKEQIRMRQMDYNAIEYDLLARLDPDKLGSDEFQKQLDIIDANKVQQTMRNYFQSADEHMVLSVVASSQEVVKDL